MTIPDLTIHSRRLGSVTVLTPIGELDCAVADQLSARTVEAARRARVLVVDLSQVTFLDCAAIGALLDAASRTRHRGGRLQVAALPDHAHRLFVLFDLYPVLGGCGDVSRACREGLRSLDPVITEPPARDRHPVIV